MAIGQLGMFAQSSYQLCKKDNEKVSTEEYLDSGIARALDVTDVLLSVTLIALGVLAFLNFLPLPEGWGIAFAVASGTAGVTNLLSSFFKGYQSTKTQIAKWQEPAEESKPKKT